MMCAEIVAGICPRCRGYYPIFVEASLGTLIGHVVSMDTERVYGRGGALRRLGAQRIRKLEV